MRNGESLDKGTSNGYGQDCGTKIVKRSSVSLRVVRLSCVGGDGRVEKLIGSVCAAALSWWKRVSATALRCTAWAVA